MKQSQYSPLSVAEMALVLFAANEGFLKDVELNKVVAFERALLSYANSENAALLAKINEKGDYNDDIAAQLKAAIQKFKATQTW
jgi:F-type H+-transporting ATPase subunit alpha